MIYHQNKIAFVYIQPFIFNDKNVLILHASCRGYFGRLLHYIYCPNLVEWACLFLSM